MLDADDRNMVKVGDGKQDEAEERRIKRKDKGKAKASPPVDLPDVVWTRIFEFFYDSVCQSEFGQLSFLPSLTLFCVDPN